MCFCLPIALDYGPDHRWFESGQELGIFLCTTASRPALGTTHPPIQWVPGALSLGAKRPGHDANHSPPPSAEVKNAWSYTSTPRYALMAWRLVKDRDGFTLPCMRCYEYHLGGYHFPAAYQEDPGSILDP
jgi:hypothetical protein